VPRNEPKGLFANFRNDFKTMQAKSTPLGVVDTLLKHPAQAVHEIIHGRPERMVKILLAIVGVCLPAYGLIMGSFSGGHQFWAVPLKTLVGVLFSALICLPSLYIFAALSGARQSLLEISGMFLLSIALNGILLVGFAPVAWVFAQSTNAAAFMGFMHLTFWCVGSYFGISLLARALSFLNDRRARLIRGWSIIFIMVVFQMCTTLRPLVGEFKGYRIEGKKFFLTHWKESLDHQQE
jgi:hypothetical protein